MFGEDADFSGFLKDVGKLRDELKAKESMKDMEKRKQGNVIRVLSKHFTRSSELGCRETRRRKGTGKD